MPQIHRQQFGCFHVTTRAGNKVPWCTREGIPNILIKELVETKKIYRTGLHAFCILLDHLHLIVTTGPKGLSRFMQSFKSNCTKTIRRAFYDSLIHWQEGFYDEHIRDERQRSAAISYVLGNGMKHGLVGEIEEWPWGSHHFQDLIDPLEPW